MTPLQALRERITSYLSGGGLFNPELADHKAVRDLLIECRATLAEAEQEPVATVRLERMAAHQGAPAFDHLYVVFHRRDLADGTLLYVAPQAALAAQQERKPLTKLLWNPMLDGLHIIESPDKPRYTLPDEVIPGVPWPEGFREEINRWSVVFLGTTNLVPPGVAYMLAGGFAVMRPSDAVRLANIAL